MYGSRVEADVERRGTSGGCHSDELANEAQLREFREHFLKNRLRGRGLPGACSAEQEQVQRLRLFAGPPAARNIFNMLEQKGYEQELQVIIQTVSWFVGGSVKGFGLQHSLPSGA